MNPRLVHIPHFTSQDLAKNTSLGRGLLVLRIKIPFGIHLLGPSGGRKTIALIFFPLWPLGCGQPSDHYSFLMSQKSSRFAATWDLAPCPHSQCLFRYVLLMPTKFSCLAAAWDLAPCPHFHYLPNDLLHHQAGDRKGKVSNFRWLRDRKIGSGILSSSGG